MHAYNDDTTNRLNDAPFNPNDGMEKGVTANEQKADKSIDLFCFSVPFSFSSSSLSKVLCYDDRSVSFVLIDENVSFLVYRRLVSGWKRFGRFVLDSLWKRVQTILTFPSGANVYTFARARCCCLFRSFVVSS